MKTSVLGYFQLVNPIQNLNLGQNITKLEIFSLFVFILFFFLFFLTVSIPKLLHDRFQNSYHSFGPKAAGIDTCHDCTEETDTCYLTPSQLRWSSQNKNKIHHR